MRIKNGMPRLRRPAETEQGAPSPTKPKPPSTPHNRNLGYGLMLKQFTANVTAPRRIMIAQDAKKLSRRWRPLVSSLFRLIVGLGIVLATFRAGVLVPARRLAVAG
ncbi:hypothetical protein ACFFYR_40025 [Paraburkholderia dipogonis]|uniref:hypothetical protein n=1 Tax=Paraburkholderia dipogonis TaxID=1211383 RepID=UPI0035E4A791